MATAAFDTCYNYIVAGNYAQAKEDFLKKYYENPKEIELLYGYIISSIFLDSLGECYELLLKESQVSPLQGKIKIITDFIRINGFFKEINNVSIILNIGLLLKKSGLLDDARIFFNVCLVIEPSNKKALTMLGEYEVIDMNIKKGISFFSQAAKF